MPRLGPAHASPSTLNTLFHTLSCTAFSIASAAVDNRPKDPAPTVVLENQIGRVLDNQDPVRMDICAAATTICPAEPCESPLRNRKCQGRSRLKMPTYGAGGGGTFRMGRVVRKIGSVVIYCGIRTECGRELWALAHRRKTKIASMLTSVSVYRIAQDAVSM